MLTTGAALTSAMDWAADPALADVEVHWLPLWGMATKASQGKNAESIHRLVTIEDHLIDGGFGSWLREAVATQPQFTSRLHTLGLDPRVCGLVGSQATLNRLGGLELERVKYGFVDAGG